MVDGLHIPIWNRSKKPLDIALSREGRNWEELTMGAIQPMDNINLIGIVIMNPHCMMNVS
jgi:hypothetical protein